jgi:hypothetical protein
MLKKVLCSLLFLFMMMEVCYAQSSRRREVYDSLLAGDQITPAVSSVMMPKGYTELILSNTLLTSNVVFLDDRSSEDLAHRYSFMINTLQATQGLSSSGRFNVGLDLSYRAGREDIDPDSSPLKVIGNNEEGLVEFDRGLTSFGLRARYVPIASATNFVIQNTFTVPVNTSKTTPFLGDDRYAFNTQLLYNHLIGRKLFLFGQLDLYTRFKKGESKTTLNTPLNIYASYILTKRLLPFALLGMSKAFGYENKQQSFTYGAGLQFQFSTMFTLNAFYSNVFAGRNSNQWKLFNLGIRKVF